MAKNLRRLVAAAIICLALPSAASAASVTPTFVPGNPTCADYGLNGLNIDRQNVAGTYSQGDLTVTITQAGNGGAITQWSSNIGVDKVIVKGGAGAQNAGDPGSNVYSYNPESTGDTDLVPPNNTGLSHVEFCWDTGDDTTPPPPTCQQAHAGEADTDGDGIVDACDNCPTTMNPGQEDTNGNGTGDACEQTQQPLVPPPPGPSNQQAAAQPPADQQSAPAGGSAPPPGDQLVLGERVSAPTARLLAATGCASRTFTAGVRGTQISRVVFKLDGKVIGVVTKRNHAGLYALRINPANYRLGVHRLAVTVTFTKASRTKARTLRGAFQRCGHRLVAPRFTG